MKIIISISVSQLKEKDVQVPQMREFYLVTISRVIKNLFEQTHVDKHNIQSLFHPEQLFFSICLEQLSEN